jgi:hypothetical protein
VAFGEQIRYRQNIHCQKYSSYLHDSSAMHGTFDAQHETGSGNAVARKG